MEASLGGTLLLIVLVVALLLIGKKRLDRLDASGLVTRLRHELDGRTPVYSAETTTGKEAEFIRDHLPQRFPWLVLLAVLVVVGGALAWWLTR
jgi:hypothetical protein